MPYSHAPEGYVCNFCRIGSGGDGVLTTRDHVVLRTDLVTAFVASHWYAASPGHVLVIPNAHHENLYDLPLDLAAPILEATQRIALAFKAVDRCDGVSTRQHNEPAGNQAVWHFHQHVFSRRLGDRLYQRHGEKALVPAIERVRRAGRLQEALRDR